MSGKYKIYILLWGRQLGKDVTTHEVSLKKAHDNPGTSSAYIGLNHIWVKDNIFDKRVDERLFFADYEDVNIKVNSTNKLVHIRNANTPAEIADSRIRYIGFMNVNGVIGSSYDYWYISEASLYDEGAFKYVQPIWEQQEQRGVDNLKIFNGTPRGIRNNFYDLLRTYTGCDDPKDFPGEHGDVYVDKKTIHDIVVPDGNGGWRPLYSYEALEKLKDRIKRQYGNLNYYHQEYECDFTTVNSGIVYQGIEQLQNEGRYHPFNIDPSKPVYLAWDIAAKGKHTDATACVVFQFINDRIKFFDWYEERGKAFIECVAELAQRPYWKYVRLAALPWDADRSASSMTPIEEAQAMFPSITWHRLDKDSIERGINLVRRHMPNMEINSEKCGHLLDCFLHYEFTYKEVLQDWSSQPKHDWTSHLMDAVRGAAMFIGEKEYFHINDNGGRKKHLPFYGAKAEEFITNNDIKTELYKPQNRVRTTHGPNRGIQKRGRYIPS